MDIVNNNIYDVSEDIEITFDDADKKQRTHFIECFRRSGINAEMLENTIQYNCD